MTGGRRIRLSNNTSLSWRHTQRESSTAGHARHHPASVHRSTGSALTMELQPLPFHIASLLANTAGCSLSRPLPADLPQKQKPADLPQKQKRSVYRAGLVILTLITFAGLTRSRSSPNGQPSRRAVWESVGNSGSDLPSFSSMVAFHRIA